jgi:hypothetical protein
MKTMSKKRTRTNQDSRITKDEPTPVHANEHAEIKQRYVPPICSSCSAIAPSPVRMKVYSSPRYTTDFVIRYLKCDRCNHTMSDYKRNEN